MKKLNEIASPTPTDPYRGIAQANKWMKSTYGEAVWFSATTAGLPCQVKTSAHPGAGTNSCFIGEGETWQAALENAKAKGKL